MTGQACLTALTQFGEFGRLILAVAAAASHLLVIQYSCDRPSWLLRNQRSTARISLGLPSLIVTSQRPWCGSKGYWFESSRGSKGPVFGACAAVRARCESLFSHQKRPAKAGFEDHHRRRGGGRVGRLRCDPGGSGSRFPGGVGRVGTFRRSTRPNFSIGYSDGPAITKLTRPSPVGRCRCGRQRYCLTFPLCSSELREPISSPPHGDSSRPLAIRFSSDLLGPHRLGGPSGERRDHRAASRTRSRSGSRDPTAASVEHQRLTSAHTAVAIWLESGAFDGGAEV